jgi:hypothetical protein
MAILLFRNTPSTRNSKSRSSVPFLVGLVLALSGVGCSGDSPSTQIPLSSTTCASGTAAIEIGDGYMRILCGCSGTGEVDGRVYSSPGNLTCHVAAAGTLVFFNYLTTILPHQVVSTGGTFVSSPVFDPTNIMPVRTHAAAMSLAGTTYPFQDIYSGMTGQIITP